MPTGWAGSIARKCDAMSHELKGAGRPALEAASLALKRSIEASRDVAAPGGRMRNVGRKGAQLGVRYVVNGSTSARVYATGPWGLIEGPTKEHDIRVRRRGGKKALSTPFGPRRRVHTRGTHGKFPWAKGSAAGVPIASNALERMYVDAVRRGFHS